MKFMSLASSALAMGLLLSACSSSEPEPEVPTEAQLPLADAPPPGAPPPGAMPPGLPPGGMPMMPSVLETDYSAAAFIKDGELQASSQLDAFSEGSVTATELNGVALETDTPKFNGLIVFGEESDVTVNGGTMSFGGVGENDFLGIGAGALVAEGKVTLRDVTISTAGATASATVATDNSVLEVYDSTLIASGGPLPEGYVPVIGPGMMEPPAPLEISGTARTHITMKDSKSYFYNTRIEADGWGALSTDAAGKESYLEFNDGTVIVRNSGYGAYSDFGANVVINRSQMDVATYGIVIAGPAEASFNEVRGSSDRNLAMIHSVMGNPAEIGELYISGGEFTSAEELIQVKSANATIEIDGARLVSESGVLIHVKKNEDPFATVVGDYSPPGVKLVLSNGAYFGDVIDTDPERALTVSLVNASLTGTVTGAEIELDSQSELINP